MKNELPKRNHPLQLLEGSLQSSTWSNKKMHLTVKEWLFIIAFTNRIFVIIIKKWKQNLTRSFITDKYIEKNKCLLLQNTKRRPSNTIHIFFSFFIFSNRFSVFFVVNFNIFENVKHFEIVSSCHFSTTEFMVAIKKTM